MKMFTAKIWYYIVLSVFIVMALGLFYSLGLPDNWRTYEYKEYGVRIDFPQKPRLKTKHEIQDGSTTVTATNTRESTIYQSLSWDRVVYQLGISVYPNDIDDAQRNEGTVAALISELALGSISTTSVTIGTHEAVRLHGIAKNYALDFTSVSFASDNRLYQLQVLCEKENCSVAKYDEFFNSFALDN